MDREKLKDIVRGYIANEIFFSAQVRDPSLLSMIFMPLMFGALSYPEPEPVGTVKPEAPVRPVRPIKAVPSVGPEGAKMDAELAELEGLINRVDFRVRWEEASANELVELREQHRLLQEQRRKLSEASIVAVERDHRILLDEYLGNLRAYRRARRAWRAQVKNWEDGEEGLANRTRAWEEGRQTWNKSVAENLGVIYAYTKDAGPRGVNGYPMFFGCAFLHRKDWDLVRTAIDRELERQKDIDLGEDL
jgi:hypothetical protein